MNFTLIGNKIKELRKSVGFSQEEIAEGICSQAQICKIEKGEVTPSATTLYLIAERLGVDINFFFDTAKTPRLDYVQEVEFQLRKETRSHDFKAVKEIVQAELNNPLFTQNKENFQLLLWHKGFSDHATGTPYSEVLQTLKEALSLTHQSEKVWSEREIDILNAIGVIYMKEQLYSDALKTFDNAIKYIHRRPIIRDDSLLVRILYNKAMVLTRLEDYEASIKMCEQAINCSIKNDSMYIFGYLYYQMGYNYELMKENRRAIHYLNKSISFFEIQKEHKFLDYIKERIDNLEAA
ncbi:helix-turn-helix domain-containing protein [Peribacillus acanthi]|uniref:helix-turn-helix domain-containing protein n=1 Tax=Peribacillus acanthi TaxID=2171554 RepID=UPI001474A65C|nr:helix-turn-helix domain-containing protein [Peribacillus acanthi]